MQEGKSKCMKCQTIINPATGGCGCEPAVAFAGYRYREPVMIVGGFD